MPFQQFRFPEVIGTLGLTIGTADLFRLSSPPATSPGFAASLAEATNLATGINTIKARGEFMIAPALLELHRLLGRSFGLFSGIELTADSDRGLNGPCDFVVTRDRIQVVMRPPILMVAATTNDCVRDCFGQCIAAMVAAQILNDRAGQPTPVFGVSTTGTEWRFLRLDGTALTFDKRTYLIDNPGAILGVLRHIITAA
jgi:hypothetical protein